MTIVPTRDSIHYCTLEFSVDQVADHVSSGVVHAPAKGSEVQGGSGHLHEPKGQHGGNPALGQLQCERAFLHSELLDMASLQVVTLAWQVDLGLEAVVVSGLLGSGQDGEVVVSKVDAGVSVESNCGTEEDQVLGDGSVQDEHGAHRTASIVVSPLVPVQVVDDMAVDGLDLGCKVHHDGRSVTVWMVFQGVVDQSDKNVFVEHEVGWQPRVVQVVENGVEKHRQCYEIE